MRAVYRHTNLIARDWRRLAAFYIEVFGCVPSPPERRFEGSWIEKATGCRPTRGILGMHLLLPGHGKTGPTLEIFQYEPASLNLGGQPEANGSGFGHIAFAVDNVEEGLREVLAHGGQALGEITELEVADAGSITFVYARDPEGNIVELQNWRRLSA